MKTFDLMKNFWAFAHENPEKMNPTHAAIYFYAIDKCNLMGGVEKFGLPSREACDVIGIKKIQTYTRYLNDLVDWGFIKMVQKSINQHTANIVALPCASPKNGTARGLANIRHAERHGVRHTVRHRACNKLTDNNYTDNNYNALEREDNFPPQKVNEILIFKEIFENEYYEKKGNTFFWDKGHSAAAGAVIEKLKKIAEDKGAAWDLQEAAAAYLQMMRVDDEWIQNKLTPQILNKQFNQIINTIKNGKNGEQSVNQLEREIAEALNRRKN